MLSNRHLYREHNCVSWCRYCLMACTLNIYNTGKYWKSSKSKYKPRIYNPHLIFNIQTSNMNIVICYMCVCVRVCVHMGVCTKNLSIEVCIKSISNQVVRVCLCHLSCWNKNIYVLLQKLFDTYFLILFHQNFMCLVMPKNFEKILIKKKIFQCNFQTATVLPVFF